VNTEPGSAIIISIQAGKLGLDMLEVSNLAEPVFQGDFSALGGSQFGEQASALGISILFPEGGPTGDIPLIPATDFDWRACTIALRMEPTNIPTLSEWGLGIFVALTGIAAVWALRRRACKF
jgi:hypothetical protein